MKTKKLLLLIPALFLSGISFGQDSSHSNSKVIFNTAPKVRSSVIPAIKSKKNTQSGMYRPTRLGSSSPMYNTYEKNDYGAGAVTTNPHKSGSGFENTQPTIPPVNSSDNTHDMRRDTRSGSSSPLYNTYKKNDYGAGAITTNPNKQGGSSPVMSTTPADSTYSVPDSTRKY